MSDLSDPGVRLRTEVTKAMRKTHLSAYEIAKRSGLDISTILGIHDGGGMPMHQTVVALAEILDQPMLAEMSAAMRTHTCPVCGTRFVDMSRRRNRVYCSKRCLGANSQRVRRGNHARTSVITANRLAAFTEAVAAYCRGCEPEGICRDDECSLRPVSPLAFIPMSSVSHRRRIA